MMGYSSMVERETVNFDAVSSSLTIPVGDVGKEDDIPARKREKPAKHSTAV